MKLVVVGGAAAGASAAARARRVNPEPGERGGADRGNCGQARRRDIRSDAGLWADDIERLDLTYAPPYSSARDPVNMAGMIASDIIRGEVKALTPQELEQFLRESGAVLIDVRTAVEREGGAIEGAAHIPLEILRADPEALDRAKTYVLYCAVGYRGYIACRLLSQRGYDVYNLTGGYSAYTMDE